jgi:predicted MFS family arabinose efflux permease
MSSTDQNARSISNPAPGPGVEEPSPGWRSRAYPWYFLSIMILVYMATAIDRLVLSIVVEPLKHEFHLTDGQIGLLGGVAFSVPFALAALPLGWLVDRVTRKKLLAGIVAFWSVLTVCGSLAGSYVALVCVRVGVGAAEAGAQPSCLSLIADTFEPKRRTTAISWFSIGPALGNLVIFLIGGFVLVNFGWRAVFLVAGLPGLLAVGLLLFTAREPVRGGLDPMGAGEKKNLLQTLKLVSRSPAIIHAIIAFTLATGVQFSVMVWIVSFLIRIHGMAPHAASVWVGLGVGIVQTSAALAIGPIADAFARGSVSRLALVPAIAALGCLASGCVMALAPTAPIALGALFVEAFCLGSLLGPSYSLLVGVAPAEARGSTMSLAKLVQMLIGSSAISFLTGAVSDAVGGPQSIRVALVVTLLGFGWAAVHFYFAGRTSRAS